MIPRTYLRQLEMHYHTTEDAVQAYKIEQQLRAWAEVYNELHEGKEYFIFSLARSPIEKQRQLEGRI